MIMPRPANVIGVWILTSAMALPVLAQAPAAEDAVSSCAEFLELDEEGRVEAMAALATLAEMTETPDEETAAEHLAMMNTNCEADPTMAAMDAFQNAVEE
jgi:hypothetical protein